MSWLWVLVSQSLPLSVSVPVCLSSPCCYWLQLTLRSSKTYLGLHRWDSWTAAPPFPTGTGTSPVQPHPSLSPAWRTAAVGPLGASGQGDVSSQPSGPVDWVGEAERWGRVQRTQEESLLPWMKMEGTKYTFLPPLKGWGRHLLREAPSKYLPPPPCHKSPLF